MKSNSIKTNYIFNTLLTLSTYIAQLLVYPYVSRVLGVDNIGEIGFVNKTIDIFLIFTTLGINTVGIREIARVKGDKKLLNNSFSTLVSFVIVTTFVTSIILGILIFVVPKFYIYKDLFLIGLAKLVFSTLLIEWFYQGLEDFKFITLRSLLIKILYIISVFLFVKESNDVVIYFLLTTGVVVINGLVNWIVSKRYVEFKFSFRLKNEFTKPMFSYGFYHLLNATFSTLNYLFIGFLCTDSEVGVYYTAENFYFIMLALISSFTRVMLPRMTYVLSHDKESNFNTLFVKSLDFVLTICIPISLFGCTFADPIINLFAGNGYNGAVMPMRIMMILLLLNSINQVYVVQVATPLKMDKEILVGSIFATVVALASNMILIKNYGAIGASFVLVISVIFANVVPIYALYKNNKVQQTRRIYCKHALYALPYIIFSIIWYNYSNIDNIYFSMLIPSLLYISYFMALPGRDYVFNIIRKNKKKQHGTV